MLKGSSLYEGKEIYMIDFEEHAYSFIKVNIKRQCRNFTMKWYSILLKDMINMNSYQYEILRVHNL